jgi:hypothetical protein
VRVIHCSIGMDVQAFGFPPSLYALLFLVLGT